MARTELDKRAVWSHFSPQPVFAAPIFHFRDDAIKSEFMATFMVTFSGKRPINVHFLKSHMLFDVPNPDLLVKEKIGHIFFDEGRAGRYGHIFCCV
jgi:hypothetical protein